MMIGIAVVAFFAAKLASLPTTTMHLEPDQISGKGWQSIRLSVRASVFNQNCFSLNVSLFAQALPECVNVRTCGRCLRKES